MRAKRSVAERLAAVDEIEVEIDKLVAGGDGLGRYDGIPIFVPRAAPGDRLKVALVQRRPSYGRARIVEVLRPGTDRRPAPCPYFERCGGCDLQHLEEPAQVRLKAEAALETLRRLGGLDKPPRLEIEVGEMWGYRQRAQLQVDPRLGVGYFARGSRDLVAVDRCPILVPELEALLTELPAALGLPTAATAAVEGAHRVPRRLDIASGDGGSVTVSPVAERLPHGPIEVTVGEFVYSVDARAFFQGHRQLLARLVERVVGDDRGSVAWDLYAGVGLFSLPLARRYEAVVAVEGDSIAARFARNNLRRARMTNVELVQSSVEGAAEDLPRELDRLVVDPPRTGLSPAVVERVLERHPRLVTYVSCHPAALARDLKRLTAVYELTELVCLDLFPQTGHLELVCRLELRG